MLFSQPPVKTFHVWVLHGPSRFDMQHLDLLLQVPSQEMPARKFRPVVAANRAQNPLPIPGSAPWARAAPRPLAASVFVASAESSVPLPDTPIHLLVVDVHAFRLQLHLEI